MFYLGSSCPGPVWVGPVRRGGVGVLVTLSLLPCPLLPCQLDLDLESVLPSDLVFPVLVCETYQISINQY